MKQPSHKATDFSSKLLVQLSAILFAFDSAWVHGVFAGFAIVLQYSAHTYTASSSYT